MTGSCTNVQHSGRKSDLGVFSAIARHAPLFFLHAGDIHYANLQVTAQEARSPDLARALYLQEYDRVLAQPRQAAFYRAVPLVHVWDDHDFGPNNANGTIPGRDGARAAYRVAVPHHPFAFAAGRDEEAGDVAARGGGGPVYHAFDTGAVRWVVTDLRSEKNVYASAELGGLTIMSPRQRAWLLAELARAAADPAVAKVVWVSSMPWLDTAFKWGEYAGERAAIGRAVHATPGLRAKLLMVSGDAHMLAVDDGSHNAWGGFPVLHASPLNAKHSVKGGPYSHGVHLGRHQFALLSFSFGGGGDRDGGGDGEDAGSVCVRFSGRAYNKTSGTDREVLAWDSCGRPSSTAQLPVFYPLPGWYRRLRKWGKGALPWPLYYPLWKQFHQRVVLSAWCMGLNNALGAAWDAVPAGGAAGAAVVAAAAAASTRILGGGRSGEGAFAGGDFVVHTAGAILVLGWLAGFAL